MLNCFKDATYLCSGVYSFFRKTKKGKMLDDIKAEFLAGLLKSFKLFTHFT